MLRSPSERATRVPLTVYADSPATEIFVIDGDFRKVDQGLGKLETKLKPGFYKLRFRAAWSQREEMVEVSGDPVVVHAPPVEFPAAAPIAGTSTVHEYHEGPAAQLSREVHRRVGRGSELFVFSRDLDPGDPAAAWQGVEILSMEGEAVAGLSDGKCDEKYAYAGLTMELDPGTYRLRVDTGGFGTYEMFVVTCPGWQTQVFGLAEEFVVRGETVRRMALRSASVLMSRLGMGFDPGSSRLRLAEQARMGLSAGRSVVSRGDLRSMIYGKYENPMLGIYGAHLMINTAHRVDHELLDTMKHNLLGLLGPHPDVLAFDLRRKSQAPPRGLTFPTPPMLRSSWDLIVHASRRRHSLVPAGSASDLLADGMLASEPWLLRRLPSAEVDRASLEKGRPPAGARLIKTLAEALTSEDAQKRLRMIASDAEAFTPLERSVLLTTDAAVAGQEVQGSEAEKPLEIRASTVLGRLDAPQSAIVRSAQSAMRKLEERGLDLGRGTGES